MNSVFAGWILRFCKMWDSNPRALLHHDLDQELILVVGLLTYKPQRGPVTTWVILLDQVPMKTNNSVLRVAVRNLRPLGLL